MFVIIIHYSDNIMQICAQLTNNLLKTLTIELTIINQPIAAHKYLIKITKKNVL